MEIYTRLSRLFPDQFREPSGLLGKLVGWLEIRRNEPPNDFALEALGVRPGDRVLEVGFGPGLSLAKLERQVETGWVAGIDYSAVMVQQAFRRNRDAIRGGRILLMHGDICNPPFKDNSFERILMVSVIYFLPDTTACLKALHRAQRPGGRIAIYQTSKADLIEAKFPVSAGFALFEPDELKAHLQAAGYVHTWHETRRVINRIGICVLGEKRR